MAGDKELSVRGDCEVERPAGEGIGERRQDAEVGEVFEFSGGGELAEKGFVGTGRNEVDDAAGADDELGDALRR